MCYWAVRRLGISTTELSKKLGVSQPSVSISVKRGEKIAKAMQFELIRGRKFFRGIAKVYHIQHVTTWIVPTNNLW